MRSRRVAWTTAAALLALICLSCGQVYRPVVIPVSTTPPNSANFHAVFALSNNIQANPGSALQIDVAGDTNIGAATMGVNPTHATILPNNSRVFVANAGSLLPGGADFVASFTPAFDSSIATGLGSQTTFTLPNFGASPTSGITSVSESGNVVTVTLSAPLVGAQAGNTIVISGVVIQGTNIANPSAYDGSFVLTSVSGTTVQYTNPIASLQPVGVGGTATLAGPTYCSYQPDYVGTSQNTALFVANYGQENGAACPFVSTDSVASVNPSTASITNIAYLNAAGSSPAPHPVALAETPNGQNLYVVNQGNNTVVDLSPTDLSTIATISPVGNTPVWAVARPDNQRVYVVTQGDGMLNTISTATNTIVASQSVGVGANYVLYDPHLNRLYVTNPNPANPAVYVFSASGGTGDTPLPLATISMAAGSTACPNGCSPSSVAALPDGSRFYVASYATYASCPDATLGATFCIVPRLTVFDAPSMTVKTVASSSLSPSLSLLASPQFGSSQYAVAPQASCVPAPTYAPGTTRFRMFTTASTDGSRVFVSICDAGVIADVSTATNTISTGSNAPDRLVGDIATPFSAGSAGSNGEPPLQNPIFLLTGQ